MAKYRFYQTMHPDGTAHGESAVLIKNNIKHYEIKPYQTNKIQATNVVVEDRSGPIKFSAIYSPPKHTIKKEDDKNFFNTLGTRFIAGGNYNAKHTSWGSRITTAKGRQLLLAVQDIGLNVVSTGEPMY